MNVDKFCLVNYEFRLHFSDYQRLVAMSEGAITFINKGSVGLLLLKLVEELVKETIELPDFVKQIEDGSRD